MRNRRLMIGFAVLALVLAACGDESSSPDGSGAATADRDLTIEVVTHGQASDPFWSVVKNGVDQAAADLGITVNYHAPETFDIPAMAQLIDTAVAAEPDGLVISNPDPEALADAIQGAERCGDPGGEHQLGRRRLPDLGILTHVGQTEFIAGQGAGQRMAEAGVTNTLCVNQEVGNAGARPALRGLRRRPGRDPVRGRRRRPGRSDRRGAGHRGGPPGRSDDRRHPDAGSDRRRTGTRRPRGQRCRSCWRRSTCRRRC